MGGGRISGHTRVAGVIGWPVEHSRSPAIHNAAYAAIGFDAVYVPMPVPPERLADALRGIVAMGFLGANVTVPHKQEVARRCDVLDDLARLTGAVNTVRPTAEGKLAGYNTDVAGYADGLDEIRAPVGSAVVLGAGGAARSVVLALTRRGHDVTVVARNAGRAASLVDLGAVRVVPWERGALARVFADTALLCDSTSAALDPATEAPMLESLPLAALPEGTLVSSLVYHREPALLAAARQRGLPVQNGGPMLVRQAARAFTLMTGREAPLSVMRAALAAAL
jgi:shikimate dehydrogenase